MAARKGKFSHEQSEHKRIRRKNMKKQLQANNMKYLGSQSDFQKSEYEGNLGGESSRAPPIHTTLGVKFSMHTYFLLILPGIC